MALPLIPIVINWLYFVIMGIWLQLNDDDFKRGVGKFENITWTLFFILLFCSPAGPLLAVLMSDDCYDDKELKWVRYGIFFEIWSLFFCVIALIILKTAY